MGFSLFQIVLNWGLIEILPPTLRPPQLSTTISFCQPYSVPVLMGSPKPLLTLTPKTVPGCSGAYSWLYPAASINTTALVVTFSLVTTVHCC